MESKISPIIRKEVDNFQNRIKEIEKLPQPYMEIIQQCARAMDSIRRKWLFPLFRLLNSPEFKDLVNSPEFRRWYSTYQCKALSHPIYLDIFESEFSVVDIQANWGKIRSKLWKRFPPVLDTNKRKERYNQILKCQTIKAYTPVCRSIYAELEALLRDELLFNNLEWKKVWEEKCDARSRRGFQNQEFNDLIKHTHPEIKLVDERLGLSDLDMCTRTFLVHLQESFKSFDPAKSDHEETKSFRHIHAHGWAKDATFMDALNGLLAFDLALELVAKIREKEQSQPNHLHQEHPAGP